MGITSQNLIHKIKFIVDGFFLKKTVDKDKRNRYNI